MRSRALFHCRCHAAISFSEPFGVVDAAAETLALQHADLALDHVEPTGVFRGVVEFEATQDATGLGGRKCLIQRAGGVDRQIVLHDTDTGGIGIMDVDEFTHAVGVVHGGAAVCYLDVAPAAMRIEGDEEIDGAVAAVLIIVALALSWPGSADAPRR
ncbi:hypothetical protein CQ13_34150 [Bradyrhizobium retamae]|uniref:Uncharacterized protein n=1 Tax=Bradyrhizobium retamae TaxID=1300035 RepID=A0A0R3MG69_9BRAD|nr:hypothetical protein CQ13_34150 [Bradyrhizobium retamae]